MRSFEPFFVCCKLKILGTSGEKSLTINFDMISSKKFKPRFEHVNYRNTAESIHPFVIERVPTMILLLNQIQEIFS